MIRRRDLPRVIAFVAVIAAAGLLIVRQPVTAPWWVYADADATYSSSALNILTGHGTKYLDHPGLPEQELLAVSFGIASLPHGGPTQRWAAGEMLHLDRARPIYRGWAIVFFVGGAALAFLLLARLLGHWTWGAAGGLLWLAQPGLEDSIQIRPDVLLAGLSLIVGFLAIRAFERRSALLLVFTAIVLGFALMVKLPAVALLVSLLLASILGHPAEGWPGRLRLDLHEWLGRHRLSVGIAVGLWLALAVTLNVRAPAPHAGSASLLLVVAGSVGVLAYLGTSLLIRRWTGNAIVRRFADPLFALLALAIALGVFISVGLLLGDGLKALRSMVTTLAGRNVNQGVTPFGTSLSILQSFPLRQALVLFIVAAVATLWGIHRRTGWPAIWFLAAAVAGVMAAGRLAETRYFALPYVLSIAPALWLFRRQTRQATPFLVWILVAYIVVPTFQHDGDAATLAHAQESQAAAAVASTAKLLKPGEAVIVPDGFPLPDDRWYTLVEDFTIWHPDYPYRFIDENAPVAALTQAHHLHVRYLIGPQADTVTKPGPITLSSGVYNARPVPGSPGVAELVSGPGT